MKEYLSKRHLLRDKRSKLTSLWGGNDCPKTRVSNESGAVLPITIVFLFLSQLLLIGTINVYRNQMYLYRLTADHYKAQTYLAYSDYWIQEKNTSLAFENRRIPEALHFQDGSASFQENSDQGIVVQVVLTNGHSEAGTIKISYQQQGIPDDVKVE